MPLVVVRADQIQPTGGPHYSLRTRLRAALLYTSDFLCVLLLVVLCVLLLVALCVLLLFVLCVLLLVVLCVLLLVVLCVLL